jgi:hypothetical protein
MHHGLLGRLFVFAMFVVFAVGYAVLRKRTLLSWRSGWLLLTAMLIDFLYVALVSPGSVSPLGLAVGTAMTVFLGVWWWRQRPEYVCSEGAKA